MHVQYVYMYVCAYVHMYIHMPNGIVCEKNAP